MAEARHELLWRLLYKAHVNHFYFERLASWYVWLDRFVRLLAALAACATLAKFFTDEAPESWQAFLMVTAVASVVSAIMGFAADSASLCEIKIGWLECSHNRDRKWAFVRDGADVTNADIMELQEAERRLEGSAKKFPKIGFLVRKAQDDACRRLGVPTRREQQ